MAEDAGASAAGTTREEGRDSLLPLSWLAAAILLASLAVAVWAYQRDRSIDAAVRHDNALTIATERLLSDLKDVETGQRGFVITGKDQYLEPYEWGLAAAGPDLGNVQALGGGDASSLGALVSDRLNDAARGIEVYRSQGATAGAAFVQSGTGKADMDRVRVEVAREQRAAGARIASAEASRSTDDLLRALSVVGLAVACAGLAWVALMRRRAHRASQALLTGVLENAPVGLGFLDGSLRIRHVNGALARMSERALSATPGMVIWEVIPQLRASLEGKLQQVLSGGRSLANVEVQAASNLRQNQVRHFQASFYPLRRAGEPGAEEGVGMVIADVTARKRAERSTKEAEERFRTLLAASAAVIWTTDANGAFVAPQPNWNRFTGQSAAEAMGWGRLACLHPEDLDAVRVAWRNALVSRTPIVSEHRLRRHDGAWRYMALSVAPVLEDDGTVREWVGSDVDITERKEAEVALTSAKDAAEAANRAKSSFLANMSHELRTPLSAVIGYSEMMEEEVEDLGERGLLTDLGKIKSNARHLLSLINDVLDLSKIEANRMDTYAEDVDVATLVEEATGTVGALVAQKDNRLAVEVAPDVGLMHTDVVKLRQCLFNLLSNASKFTEKGTVTLRVRREGTAPEATLVFDVADTGIGMTEEQLGRLFQRFAQADETTTRKFGGTGLGLALTRAFAHLLGGSISVRSTYGEGTTFTLRLPAAMPEQRVYEDGTIALDALRPDVEGERQTVLVIDDDRAQLDLMVKFLERQGFAVRTAMDAQTGLDIARAVRPRAITLDVLMPHIDGWAVLTALKADPELAKIPVVMVTFHNDNGLSATLGAADHVDKPVRWDKLRSVMDRFRDAEGDVLVVDDDPNVRERLRATLERQGWTVVEAVNGRDALVKVMHGPPRAILLDLNMPVMDGFQFLHDLREKPGCGDIPVIVFSARDISLADRRRLHDADRILTKTTSLKDVAAELRALVPTPVDASLP
ncbi:response regulator [Lichenibacterium minor]|uniref:histidine kinase n=1 Tax=Lichenibacterium minor TaxID=2316528 RepID=A0A4Q2TYX5_9HYPH|nr:response regulator [Lichenibacterium minor]RYC29329.1 response regulator [Lichenibacterium minor]